MVKLTKLSSTKTRKKETNVFPLVEDKNLPVEPTEFVLLSFVHTSRLTLLGLNLTLKLAINSYI